MSFLSDLGSFISDVHSVTDEFSSVKDDVVSVAQDALSQVESQGGEVVQELQTNIDTFTQTTKDAASDVQSQLES